MSIIVPRIPLKKSEIRSKGAEEFTREWQGKPRFAISLSNELTAEPHFDASSAAFRRELKASMRSGVAS